MSEITARDEIRAALHRLRVAEGYAAVESLLAKVGAANVNNVNEDAYETIMATCPPLLLGEGIMAASGDKPSTKETLNAMAFDKNEGGKSTEVGDAIKDVIESAPTLQEGLDRAAKGLHMRRAMKAAK